MKSRTLQIWLVLAAVICSSVAAPGRPAREDGHVVSDSSASSNESSSSAEPAESIDSAEVKEHKKMPGLEQLNEDALHKPVQARVQTAVEVSSEDVEQPQSNKYSSEFISPEVTRIGSWEHSYKHGIVPAKLPTEENDRAHRFRHSIVHGYGQDIHI